MFLNKLPKTKTLQSSRPKHQFQPQRIKFDLKELPAPGTRAGIREGAEEKKDLLRRPANKHKNPSPKGPALP